MHTILYLHIELMALQSPIWVPTEDRFSFPRSSVGMHTILYFYIELMALQSPVWVPTEDRGNQQKR